LHFASKKAEKLELMRCLDHRVHEKLDSDFDNLNSLLKGLLCGNQTEGKGYIGSVNNLAGTAP
jgi:hypothetical protein